MAEGLPHEWVRFAHNSERQFAKLLDFYGISWEYEPVEFVLERDRDGEPVAAFRPDFYLPEHDLYIEITTLSQKLVTKKNRKVRRLGELHPEVQVKLLYQRDYLALLVKYGLEQPSQLRAGQLGAGQLGAGQLVGRDGGEAAGASRPAAPQAGLSLDRGPVRRGRSA
ncbi:MAG: hypothetical protein ACRDYD_00530 [Acidimicrobiales bacterium]